MSLQINDESNPESFSLPLSWFRTDFEHKSEIVNLASPSARWYAILAFGSRCKFSDWLTKVDSESLKTVIVRGCSSYHSNLLEQSGFKKYLMGSEAVLDFQKEHFVKRSVKELVKRGSRAGQCIEIPFSFENAKKLERFKRKTKLADRPNLDFLFLNSFVQGTRLFVIESVNGDWHAAIVVSKNSNEKIQTELLLRSLTASKGVMEFLISEIFRILRSEKRYKYWSLGEVPFAIQPGGPRKFLGKLISTSGKLIRYAYNYKGLFFFKNKFNPDWMEVYLCAKPRLKISHMILIFFKTNLARLALHQLIRKIF